MPDSNERKFKIRDLIQIPKRERSQRQRKKTFTTHFLSSPENQAKIRAAHEASQCKETLAKARQEALKKVLVEEKETKKKKKIICRADTVKARQLPMAVRGGGVVGVGGGVLLMHQSCNFEV